MPTENQYSKQDCIDSLQKAAKELGRSPMLKEYRKLDIYPTYRTFRDRFGSWNEAKRAAGLEEYSSGRAKSKKPPLLKMGVEEWENLPPSNRHRIKKRIKLDILQINVGCERCGYDSNPRALQFHHINPELKEFNISQNYPSSTATWEETKEEIKKCEILCANCHRIETSKESLSLDV